MMIDGFKMIFNDFLYQKLKVKKKIKFVLKVFETKLT